jgi:hypothetical protein
VVKKIIKELKMKTKIMAITIQKRSESVAKVQPILTEFSAYIHTRLGLSNALDCCQDNGLIILQLHCEDDVAQKLTQKLEQIDGVFVNAMDLKCC